MYFQSHSQAQKYSSLLLTDVTRYNCVSDSFIDSRYSASAIQGLSEKHYASTYTPGVL